MWTHDNWMTWPGKWDRRRRAATCWARWVAWQPCWPCRRSRARREERSAGRRNARAKKRDAARRASRRTTAAPRRTAGREANAWAARASAQPGRSPATAAVFQQMPAARTLTAALRRRAPTAPVPVRAPRRGVGRSALNPGCAAPMAAARPDRRVRAMPAGATLPMASGATPSAATPPTMRPAPAAKLVLRAPVAAASCSTGATSRVTRCAGIPQPNTAFASRPTARPQKSRPVSMASPSARVARAARPTTSAAPGTSVSRGTAASGRFAAAPGGSAHASVTPGRSAT